MLRSCTAEASSRARAGLGGAWTAPLRPIAGAKPITQILGLLWVRCFSTPLRPTTYSIGVKVGVPCACVPSPPGCARPYEAPRGCTS
jgi:hypothetical protein